MPLSPLVFSTPVFLSTPSARRATLYRWNRQHVEPFLSTPSARRATFFVLCHYVAHTCISIHALREEGDRAAHDRFRRAFRISIHALREEGDLASMAFLQLLPYFYPRPPRGGRRFESTAQSGTNTFLSTPSARRATTPPFCIFCFSCHFYPRPPRGGRPVNESSFTKSFEISIHALREEGDRPTLSIGETACISIHALREEGDLAGAAAATWGHISIHALREEGDGSRLDPHPGSVISIHALREEGDLTFTGCCRGEFPFLSTPSARRATASGCIISR